MEVRFIIHHQILHIESIVVSFIEHVSVKDFKCDNQLASVIVWLPVWTDDNADHDAICDR